MTGEAIQEPLLPEGPGRRLREARTALKLSRDDVAIALRLKPVIIRALEADDTAALPAPIYVNGYLRNYARLLGIPAEPLLEAYAQLEVEAPPVVSEIVQPSSRLQSRLVVRGVGLLVFAAVLAGFLSWLKNQDFDWFGGATETGHVAGAGMPGESVRGTGQAEVLTPGKVVEPGPAPVVSPELPQEEQAAAPPLTAPEHLTDTPPGQGALEKQQVRADTGPSVPPVAEPTTPHIVLRADADCWVQITDAKGRRLVYDLVRAGQTREVSGLAPLKVFLGNAAGVRMEVNGQDYDFSQHVDGKMARFTVTIGEDA